MRRSTCGGPWTGIWPPSRWSSTFRRWSSTFRIVTRWRSRVRDWCRFTLKSRASAASSMAITTHLPPHGFDLIRFSVAPSIFPVASSALPTAGEQPQHAAVMLGLLAEPVDGEAKANPNCYHRYRNHFSVPPRSRSSPVSPGVLLDAIHRELFWPCILRCTPDEVGFRREEQSSLKSLVTPVPSEASQ